MASGAALSPGAPTVVIKAVGDLVSDHHANAPEVQGLRLVLAEEGGLQDPRGEHCRGVGGGRGTQKLSEHSLCPDLQGPALSSTKGGTGGDSPISQARKPGLRARGRGGGRRSGTQVRALCTVHAPSGQGPAARPPRAPHPPKQTGERPLRWVTGCSSCRWERRHPLPFREWVGEPQEDGQAAQAPLQHRRAGGGGPTNLVPVWRVERVDHRGPDDPAEE